MNVSVWKDVGVTTSDEIDKKKAARILLTQKLCLQTVFAIGCFFLSAGLPSSFG